MTDTLLPLIPVRITEEVLNTLEDEKEYHLISEAGETWFTIFHEEDRAFSHVRGTTYIPINPRWSIYLPVKELRSKEEILLNCLDDGTGCRLENYLGKERTRQVLSAMDEYLISNLPAQVNAEREAALINMLEEAKLQIEYLHGKFKATGTGNSVISRIKVLLQKVESQT